MKVVWKYIDIDNGEQCVMIKLMKKCLQWCVEYQVCFGKIN